VPGSQTDDTPPPAEPTETKANMAGATGVEVRWLALSAFTGAWIWAML